MESRTTQLIRSLSAAYPSFRPMPETLQIYAAKMQKYPVEDVMEACDRLIETSKYFPSLSELIAMTESMRYNKDLRHPHRYRKVNRVDAKFDDASLAMMRAKGYRSVDDFTEADVQELLKAAQ